MPPFNNSGRGGAWGRSRRPYSWLNLVERFFAELTAKQIKRGIDRSVRALVEPIEEFIHVRNEGPRPFIWMKSADEILASIARYPQRTSDSGHQGAVRSGRWHREDERAAGPRSVLGPDAAALRFHDASRDIEPQAQTTPVAAPDLPEPPEDGFQVLGRDSRSRVRDRHAHLAIHALCPDGNARPRRRELDRVSDQVGDDLQRAVVIESGEKRRTADLFQPDSARIGGGLEDLD